MKINEPWKVIGVDAMGYISIVDNNEQEVCQIYKDTITDDDQKRAELICKLINTYGQVIADEMLPPQN